MHEFLVLVEVRTVLCSCSISDIIIIIIIIVVVIVCIISTQQYSCDDDSLVKHLYTTKLEIIKMYVQFGKPPFLYKIVTC